MTRKALTVALILLASNSTIAQPATATSAQIVIPLDGKTLVLEDNGTESGKRLYELGKTLRALDNDIQRWKQQPVMLPNAEAADAMSPGRKNHRPAQDASAQDALEIRRSMLTVMEQNRADALEEIEAAWDLSHSRSWGSPTEHLNSAQEEMESIRSVMEKSMPSSLYCLTEIKSSYEPSHIHYMPEGAFRSGGKDWVSYTPGTKIKIGNYRFRVSGDGEVFNQKVTILQDPFVHVIQPL